VVWRFLGGTSIPASTSDFRLKSRRGIARLEGVSVSVVIPCLNEEGSIQEAVTKARSAFNDADQLEVLVVDNGSTDRSRFLAEQAGARVVPEGRRGYGSAIMRGLSEAQGDFIVIADADNTYDFHDGAKLVEELKKGADFAIGDRLHGQIEEGAMPSLHRHLGTPVLTWILNRFFGSRVKDINCGLRAVRRDCVSRLRLRSPGMEFASEMVIHAQKAGLRFAETEIRYYKRRAGDAKLRTFRDGWRHLRFILLCAPFPVFFVPSLVAAIAGVFLSLSDRLGFQMLGGSLFAVAFQLMAFGVLAKAVMWVNDSFTVDKSFGRLLSYFKLEYGILFSFALAALGAFFAKDFNLDALIRGGWICVLAVQIFFSSFLLSIILMRRQDH